MRTSILTVLSFGTLLAFSGCDTEDEAFLDDASLDPDESVAFRCSGQGCLQSPHVGTFNISNMSEDTSIVASPDGSTTVQRIGMKKSGVTYTQLRVTDEAKCEVRQSVTTSWESCVSTIIDLKVTEGGVARDAKIEITGETIDSSGSLTVYKYDVNGDLDPLTNAQSKDIEFPICPVGGDDGTRRVVMLPDVLSTWIVTDDDDGLAELVASTSTRFTLACDGYAEAKGYVRGRVLPNTGGARNYGVANYNGFTHAMRALFRKHDSSIYSSLTQHGTPITILDLKNNPPLFNELSNSPPAVGYGVYLLESAYNGDPAVQGGRRGATCKMPYADLPCSGANQLAFPNGIHRRPEYSPPISVIGDWNLLPECDMDYLDEYGSVGVFKWYQGQCSSSSSG